jgi:hypothetical protein
VVLIEPNDTPYLRLSMGRLARVALRKVQVALGRSEAAGLVDFGPDSFEPAGNYVYCVSERELEKAAYGLNLPAVAFKGLNDHYAEGVEYEEAVESSAVFRRVRTAIERADRECARGLRRFGMLVAVVFIEPVGRPLRDRLTAAGFRVRDLEPNPHSARPAAPEGET